MAAAAVSPVDTYVNSLLTGDEGVALTFPEGWEATLRAVFKALYVDTDDVERTRNSRINYQRRKDVFEQSVIEKAGNLDRRQRSLLTLCFSFLDVISQLAPRKQLSDPTPPTHFLSGDGCEPSDVLTKQLLPRGSSTSSKSRESACLIFMNVGNVDSLTETSDTTFDTISNALRNSLRLANRFAEALPEANQKMFQLLFYLYTPKTGSVESRVLSLKDQIRNCIAYSFLSKLSVLVSINYAYISNVSGLTEDDVDRYVKTLIQDYNMESVAAGNPKVELLKNPRKIIDVTIETFSTSIILPCITATEPSKLEDVAINTNAFNQFRQNIVSREATSGSLAANFKFANIIGSNSRSALNTAFNLTINGPRDTTFGTDCINQLVLGGNRGFVPTIACATSLPMLPIAGAAAASASSAAGGGAPGGGASAGGAPASNPSAPTAPAPAPAPAPSPLSPSPRVRPSEYTVNQSRGASTITRTAILPYLTNKSRIRGTICTYVRRTCFNSVALGQLMYYFSPVFASYLTRVNGYFSTAKTAALQLDNFLARYADSREPTLTLNTETSDVNVTEATVPPGAFVETNFREGFENLEALGTILVAISINSTAEDAVKNVSNADYWIEKVTDRVKKDTLELANRSTPQKPEVPPSQAMSYFANNVQNCLLVDYLFQLLRVQLGSALNDVFVSVIEFDQNSSRTMQQEIRSKVPNLTTLLTRNSYESPFSATYRPYLVVRSKFVPASGANTTTKCITVNFNEEVRNDAGQPLYPILELTSAIIFEKNTFRLFGLLVRAVWSNGKFTTSEPLPWVENLTWIPPASAYNLVQNTRDGTIVRGLRDDDQVFILYQFTDNSPPYVLDFDQAEALLESAGKLFVYRLLTFDGQVSPL